MILNPGEQRAIDARRKFNEKVAWLRKQYGNDLSKMFAMLAARHGVGSDRSRVTEILEPGLSFDTTLLT